jgi:hypothetical protein
MNRAIQARLVVCTLLTAAGTLGACSTSSNPAGGGNFDSGAFDASFGEDGGTDAASTSLAACLSGVVSGPAPASCAPFVQCLESQCASDLATCFGPGYATGTITGSCAGFETCARQNACTPSAGVSCAGQTTGACQECVQTLVACASTSCLASYQACAGGLLSGLYDAGTKPGVDAGEDATTSDSAAPDSGGVDSTVTDAGDDAGSGGTDLSWAQWPIPNSPSDIEAGAPNPQSYTSNGDGTVTDNVTGLEWQQVPEGPDGGTFPTFQPAEASGYCTSIALAGHADWRLPTAIELTSIVDYAVASPAAEIDPVHFPGTPATWFWSATPMVGGTVPAWAVHFGLGYTQLPALVQDYPVRCVRGGTGPFARTPGGAPAGRYTTTGSGPATTVYDTKTHLTWQQQPVLDGGAFPQVTFAGAQAYCAGITLDGAPARLPTVGELLSLFDDSNSGSVTPSIDPTYFPGTPAIAADFWSSTPVSYEANYQWYVTFTGDGSNPQSVYDPYSYVRCVR